MLATMGSVAERRLSPKLASITDSPLPAPFGSAIIVALPATELIKKQETVKGFRLQQSEPTFCKCNFQ
jgi:hypothetical protein